MGFTAAFPDRRTNGAVPRPAGSLLFPRFFTASSHLTPPLRVRPRTAKIRHLRQNNQLYKRRIPSCSKNGFRKFNFTDSFVVEVKNFRLHRTQNNSFRLSFGRSFFSF